jgi:hypothetical protein
MLHPKLVVGEVNDPLEHEANRIADQVMRMAEPATIHTAPAEVQRLCAACEEEPQTTAPFAQSVDGGEDEFASDAQTVVFRKAAFAAPPATARSSAPVADRLLARRGGGEKLQTSTRQRMEGAFGRDFASVRVHHDAEADSFCRQFGALAFTLGSDIFFGNGMFDPGGSSGARVLAHELTHVVQQGRAGPHNQSDAFAPVAAKQGISEMSNRGPDQTIRRLATWVGGPVNEVNNLADSIVNGPPVGITKPVLNGTAFVGGAAARGLLLPPTLSFTNVPAPAPAPVPAPGAAPAPAPAGTVNAQVASVDINTGGFDETVLAPGPWSIVAPTANVGARFPSLAACTGAGNSTFSANGKPSDAAMFAANRRHEDHHAADHHIAFDASVGAWDVNLSLFAVGNFVFPGPTNADAQAALFAAAGGTPDQIADSYWNKVAAAGAAFHATPTGGPVSTNNPTSNADCSTSAVDATNPS